MNNIFKENAVNELVFKLHVIYSLRKLLKGHKVAITNLAIGKGFQVTHNIIAMDKVVCKIHNVIADPKVDD